MTRIVGVILKGLFILAGALVCLFALCFGMFYMGTRAKELPVKSARNYIRLEEGDKVIYDIEYYNRNMKSAVNVRKKEG